MGGLGGWVGGLGGWGGWVGGGVGWEVGGGLNHLLGPFGLAMNPKSASHWPKRA